MNSLFKYFFKNNYALNYYDMAYLLFSVQIYAEHIKTY